MRSRWVDYFSGPYGQHPTSCTASSLVANFSSGSRITATQRFDVAYPVAKKLSRSQDSEYRYEMRCVFTLGTPVHHYRFIIMTTCIRLVKYLRSRGNLRMLISVLNKAMKEALVVPNHVSYKGQQQAVGEGAERNE